MHSEPGGRGRQPAPGWVIPEIENAWRAEGAPRAERPSGIFRRVAGPPLNGGPLGG